MGIYNDLKQVKKLTNSSLGAIVENTNRNFVSLTSAFSAFLTNVGYDETYNNITFNKITGSLFEITDTLTMLQNGSITLTIDSQGRITGKSLIVEIAQAKRVRFTQFPDRPDSGTLGEVVYTGPNSPNLSEGLWLYTQYGGWVKLNGSGAGSDYLSQLLDVHIDGSPGLKDGDVLVYDSTVHKWVNGAGRISYTEVTYAELVNLVNTSSLVPFSYYIITDYITTGYFISTDFYFESNVERLVVQALTENVLNSDAYSLDYPNDRLKYTIGVPDYPGLLGKDPCLYGVSGLNLPPNYRGFILERTDTVRNIMSEFDWRNWQYRLYSLNCDEWDSGTSYVRGDLVTHTKNGDSFVWLSHGTSTNIEPGTDSSAWMLISNNIKLMFSPSSDFFPTFNIDAVGHTYNITLEANPSDFEVSGVFNFTDLESDFLNIQDIFIPANNIMSTYLATGGQTFACTRIPHVIFKTNLGSAIWKNVKVTGFSFIFSSLALNIDMSTLNLLCYLQTYIPPLTSEVAGAIIDVKISSSGKTFITAPSITNMNIGNINGILIGIDSKYSFDGFQTGLGVTNILLSGSDQGPCSDFKLESSIEDLVFIDSESITVNNNASGVYGQNCVAVKLEEFMQDIDLGYNTATLEIKPNIIGLDLTSSSTVHGNTHHKTIFRNTNGDYRMSYYDATDALVVVDPTI